MSLMAVFLLQGQICTLDMSSLLSTLQKKEGEEAINHEVIVLPHGWGRIREATPHFSLIADDYWDDPLMIGGFISVPMGNGKQRKGLKLWDFSQPSL